MLIFEILIVNTREIKYNFTDCEIYALSLT